MPKGFHYDHYLHGGCGLWKTGNKKDKLSDTKRQQIHERFRSYLEYLSLQRPLFTKITAPPAKEKKEIINTQPFHPDEQTSADGVTAA